MSSNAFLTVKKSYLFFFLDLFLGHGNDKNVELILLKLCVIFPFFSSCARCLGGLAQLLYSVKPLKLSNIP